MAYACAENIFYRYCNSCLFIESAVRVILKKSLLFKEMYNDNKNYI